MNHLTEEELILHYYGEEGDALAAEQHLDQCDACRGVYCSLQRVLNVVDSLPVPECGPDYGAKVWQRIERQLPVRRRVILPGICVALGFRGNGLRGPDGGGIPGGPLLSASAE